MECVMLAFFSQRRAVLRPFSCDILFGRDSTAKRWQSARCVAETVDHDGTTQVQGHKLRMTARRLSTRARLVRPAQSKPDLTAFLRPIPHRGLHNRRLARIENTAPAFLAA